MNNTVINIAGMHRSGTSLTANWLQNAGLFIGERLLGEASSNQKGHFEDLDFLELHIQQFKKWGIHESGLLIPYKQEFKFDIDIKEVASKLILERNRAHKIWGWKEPRSTLFLNEWKSLIPQMKVIAVYREPEFVIQSLYKRLKKNKWYYSRNPLKKIFWYLDIDKNPNKWFQKFGLLYNLYNLEIIEFKKNYPNDTIIVNLKNLIENQVLWGEKLNRKFNVNLSFENCNSVFDSKLMTQQIKEKIIIPKAALDSYEIMERLSNI